MSTPAWKKAATREMHEKQKREREREMFLKPKPVLQLKEVRTYVQTKPFIRETPKYASLSTPTTIHACSKREPQRYTGTLIKGIATMHKSNAVPVISDEHAVDIARMRRG